MGRYTGPKWKQSRREGTELRDEGKRALAKRNYPPGIHGPMSVRRRLTSYAKQLREKQKAKRIYGLYEKQFHNLYEKAINLSGDASVNIQQLLESRLDNIIFRIGWATSRQQARQLVTHGHIEVNERKVNIPSFLVKPGMKIAVKANYQKKTYWVSVLPKMKKKTFFSNIAYDFDTNIVTITTMPDVNELTAPFNPTLIIEFYSK
ncbi:MAG: 30S ribosomal protein S4 [Parcubacteria group bacterium CG1_02_37_51]|uniref:Small ribosomal subunit protein uS4 n=2 Tax=Candidatus Komeiliibacteriota TaxID=1817908 RepID=A0A2M8DPU8_9BACT|nr:MAG: 30S ribosomal protein S4 [Parcubacteria group bacterium CG1_02_37_51]PIY94526.1 MAG: 30S ribosomal protein S4 [Candidatus Komeilibacteria bacterium CG_4_10_14_0_8_um_filter_37_78]PJC00924.1 MAG: 30S ribosomal protein S4 [Candidatus Komeilibacteria bacterium CG_4_9_14_0_8_um_filter_36_9]